MHRRRKSHRKPCRFHYLSLGKATKWRQPCQSCQIRTKPRSALTEVMGQNQRQLQETVPRRKQKESTKGEEQVTRRMSLNTQAHWSVSWKKKEKITISKSKKQSIAESIQHTTFSWASMQTRSSEGISEGRNSDQQNRQPAFSVREKWPSPYQ